MLYVLSGPDDFSLNEALEEIKRGLGDPEALATNLTVLDGQQLTVDQLRAVCEAAPFLAEKRLVIIRGLLGRFQAQRAQGARSGSRSGSRGRGRKSGPAENGHQALADYLPTVPETTVVVLVDAAVTGTNLLYKALAGQSRLQSFPLLREAALRTWLQKRVKDAGGSISQEAVTLLARLVGSNLWVMSSEIDKLLLYAAGRRIEEDDVQRLVGYVQQANVFAMVDAIIEGRAQAAERLMQDLLQSGAAPPYLLAMLARQVRLMVRARDYAGGRTSAAELRDRLGLTSEFVARKALEQARRYSMPRLKQVCERLLETDVAIKTSAMEPELALSILVAELCQRPETRVSHVS